MRNEMYSAFVNQGKSEQGCDAVYTEDNLNDLLIDIAEHLDKVKFATTTFTIRKFVEVDINEIPIQG